MNDTTPTLKDKFGNEIYSDEWYEISRKREGTVALIMITILMGLLGFILFHNISAIDDKKISGIVLLLFFVLAWALYRKPLCRVFGKRIWVKVISDRPNVHFYPDDEKTRICIKLSDGNRSWRKTREFDDEASFYRFFNNTDNPIAMYKLGTIHVINWSHRMAQK